MPPTTDFWINLPVRSLDLLSNPTDITDPSHPNNPNNVAVRLSNIYLHRTDTLFPSGIQNLVSPIPPTPNNLNPPNPKALPAYANGTSATYPYRVKEDVVLENVIGFDVKVWDPGAPLFYVSNNQVLNPSSIPPGSNPQIVSLNEIPYDPNNPADPLNPAYATGYSGAYVDLGYAARYFAPAAIPSLLLFGNLGDLNSGLRAADLTTPRIYDTWSTHYENTIYNPNSYLYSTPINPLSPDTTRPDLFPGKGTNGFDDDGNGIVDDVNEIHVPPPYAAPLRGIQVKIRIFEPDSRQIREVTVVQDFLPR
jgi:hypothetical protein